MATSINVLIVEDSPEDAELIVMELRRGGFEPSYERVDAYEAMQTAIDDHSFDVVIADYVMPNFSGLAAIGLIRRKCPDLPCIIISGKVGEEAAVEAMRAGAHDYLVKGQLARLAPAIRREIIEAKLRRERRHDEEVIRQQLAAMESSMDGMAMLDSTGKFVYINRAHIEIYGYDSVDELIGKSWQILYEDAEARRFENEIFPLLWQNKKWRGEATGRRREGSAFPQEMSLSLINGGGIVCIVRDISERKEAEEKLRYMSTHDALTGLYNRAYFDEELARLERGRKFPISIIMSDVDGLKAINDRLGHAEGDALLKLAAVVLKDAFRAEDVVARIGGDEFAALLPNTDAATAREVMERLKCSLAEHNKCSPLLPLSLSVGASIAENGKKLLDAWRQADARMYLDKRSKISRTATKRDDTDRGPGEP